MSILKKGIFSISPLVLLLSPWSYDQFIKWLLEPVWRTYFENCNGSMIKFEFESRVLQKLQKYVSWAISTYIQQSFRIQISTLYLQMWLEKKCIKMTVKVQHRRWAYIAKMPMVSHCSCQCEGMCTLWNGHKTLCLNSVSHKSCQFELFVMFEEVLFPHHIKCWNSGLFQNNAAPGLF